MYYVDAASINSLHQLLPAELGRIVQTQEHESLKHRARSDSGVPLKGLAAVPIGALAL